MRYNRSKEKRIPSSIVAIGLASFLMNAASVMAFSIMGLYLANVIGANLGDVGFFDGAVEAASYLIRIFTGILSDFLMNRKGILSVGVFLLFVAKPLEATLKSFYGLFFAKIIERLGNGVQSTTRDAIVGDWAPKKHKGVCFGFRQMLAALGSVVGAVLAFVTLRYSNEDYQFVFWMASIPSALALLIVIFFVKDKKIQAQEGKQGKIMNKNVRKITFRDIKNLGPKYWTFIFIAGTYTFSKVVESLVILYVIDLLGLPNYIGPVVMIVYSISSSMIAYPAGALSDKLKKREDVFLLGIIMLLISNVFFVYGQSNVSIIIAVLFLGAYIGISQLWPAKIVDIVPKDLKGTGIGIFNLVCAVAIFSAGKLSGSISELYSKKHAFILSFAIGVISFISLLIARRMKFNNPSKD